MPKVAVTTPEILKEILDGSGFLDDPASAQISHRIPGVLPPD